MIIDFISDKPNCPTLLHFGRYVQSIPMGDVEKIKSSHPGVGVHIYEADHGFNCDAREQFDPNATAVAMARTIRLFNQNLS